MFTLIANVGIICDEKETKMKVKFYDHCVNRFLSLHFFPFFYLKDYLEIVGICDNKIKK